MRTGASVVGLLMIFACGGGGGGGGSSQQGFSPVGSWTRNAMSIGNETVGCPGSILHDGITTSCTNDTVSIRADGTFVGSNGSGTWVLEGSTLRVRDSSGSESFRLSWSAGGDVMALEVGNPGVVPFVETAYFTRPGGSQPKARVFKLGIGQEAKEVSADGNVVLVLDPANQVSYRNVWTLAGGVQPAPPGMRVLRVSPDGRTLLGSSSTTGEPAYWTAANGMQILPHAGIPVGLLTSIMDCANDGSLYLWRSEDQRSFLSTSNGSLTELLATGHPVRSIAAEDLSLSGEVATGDVQLAGGTGAAFRWTRNGGFVVIPEFVGAGHMDDSGNVILGVLPGGSAGLWQSGSGTQAVPVPSGFSILVPNDISGDGTVIYCQASDPTFSNAVAWVITNSSSKPLARIVAEQGGGAALVGLKLTGYEGHVSSDGKTFTGYGKDSQGRGVGFIVKLP